MVDDEDGKVRRNLVTFSAAICLVWFLEVPIGPLVRSVLKETPWTPEVWRVWTAILGVLIYLTLRYRFSEQYVHIATQLRDDLTTQLTADCYEYALKAVGGAVYEGRNTKALGFDLTAFLESLRAAALQKTDSLDRLDLLSIKENGKRKMSGVLIVEVMAVRKDRVVEQQVETVKYAVRGAAAAFMNAKALWRVAVYSKLAITNAVPLFLACAALFVAVSGLVLSLATP